MKILSRTLRPHQIPPKEYAEWRISLDAGRGSTFGAAAEVARLIMKTAVQRVVLVGPSRDHIRNIMVPALREAGLAVPWTSKDIMYLPTAAKGEPCQLFTVSLQSYAPGDNPLAGRGYMDVLWGDEMTLRQRPHSDYLLSHLRITVPPGGKRIYSDRR
jgi:hypothetical protein